MKTKYKYIHFEKFKTENFSGYQCFDRDNITLGFIRYCKKWKCFIFVPFPFSKPYFDQSCLEDIIDFMNQLKKKREEEKDG